MSILKPIIFLSVLCIIIVGCENKELNTVQFESTKLTHKEENIISNTAKIEEYYPLYEGAAFKPYYVPDYRSYWEEVVLRHNNRALLLCTVGRKASEIRVYQISESAIYEVYRLTDEDDIVKDKNYSEIMKLIENKHREKLIQFLDNLEDIPHNKMIMKYPPTVGPLYSGAEIIDYNADESIKKIPLSIKRNIVLPDNDIVIVKTDGYYIFYKKYKGIVIVFDPKTLISE